MQLPFDKKFTQRPKIEADSFVEYFNLEFAPLAENEKFKLSDFEYLGLFLDKEDKEVMYWSVENCSMFAIKQPFDGGYMNSMTDDPPIQSSIQKY
jgi:hypothetical protein